MNDVVMGQLVLQDAARPFLQLRCQQAGMIAVERDEMQYVRGYPVIGNGLSVRSRAPAVMSGTSRLLADMYGWSLAVGMAKDVPEALGQACGGFARRLVARGDPNLIPCRQARAPRRRAKRPGVR